MFAAGVDGASHVGVLASWVQETAQGVATVPNSSVPQMAALNIPVVLGTDRPHPMRAIDTSMRCDRFSSGCP